MIELPSSGFGTVLSTPSNCDFAVVECLHLMLAWGEWAGVTFFDSGTLDSNIPGETNRLRFVVEDDVRENKIATGCCDCITAVTYTQRAECPDKDVRKRLSPRR